MKSAFLFSTLLDQQAPCSASSASEDNCPVEDDIFNYPQTPVKSGKRKSLAFQSGSEELEKELEAKTKKAPQIFQSLGDPPLTPRSPKRKAASTRLTDSYDDDDEEQSAAGRRRLMMAGGSWPKKKKCIYILILLLIETLLKLIIQL